ncbi:MAG: hypothetical protein H8E46_04425 [FCB group bacterium]|nr:hypothetical protein [FCB group bacterium]
MEKQFSWKDFENMTKMLESIGYGVVIFGPLLGVALLIFGSTMIRIGGGIIILASLLIAVYHFSFSYLMHGIKEIMNKLQTPEEKIE